MVIAPSPRQDAAPGDQGCSLESPGQVVRQLQAPPARRQADQFHHRRHRAAARRLRMGRRHHRHAAARADTLTSHPPVKEIDPNNHHAAHRRVRGPVRATLAVIPRAKPAFAPLETEEGRGEPRSCSRLSAHQSLINRRLSPPLPVVRSLHNLALQQRSTPHTLSLENGHENHIFSRFGNLEASVRWRGTERAAGSGATSLKPD